MNTYLEKFIVDNFKTPGKALDLGAGAFLDVLALRKKGWDIEGVDIKEGVDLENYYLSKNKPFDLVYANYVLNKIENKDIFLDTAYANLENNGWFFLHVFDASDATSSSKLTEKSLKELLSKHNFKNIKTEILEIYDDQEGHKHFHKILQATASK